MGETALTNSTMDFCRRASSHRVGRPPRPLGGIDQMNAAAGRAIDHLPASGSVPADIALAVGGHPLDVQAGDGTAVEERLRHDAVRSEEHTSELQSRLHL